MLEGRVEKEAGGGDYHVSLLVSPCCSKQYFKRLVFRPIPVIRHLHVCVGLNLIPYGHVCAFHTAKWTHDGTACENAQT